MEFFFGSNNSGRDDAANTNDSSKHDTSNTNDNKKNDDNTKKLILLKDARSIFHGDSSFVCENPRKCCAVLSRLLLYLPKNYTSSSEKFTDTEATEVFFGVTTLFVSNDAPLRRLLYLFLKDAVDNYLCLKDVAVYALFSSLRKDFDLLENKSPHRRNALRIMANIARPDNTTTFPDIEKRMKWSINPNFPTSLISSVLVSVSSNSLDKKYNNDFVQQWIPEITKVLISPTIERRQASNNPMIPFHAMQLLYQIKSQEKMGIFELVQQYTTTSQNNDNEDIPFFLLWKDSPLVLILLIRCYTKLLCDDSKEEKAAQEGKDDNNNHEEAAQEGKGNNNHGDEVTAQEGKDNKNHDNEEEAQEGENNNNQDEDEEEAAQEEENNNNNHDDEEAAQEGGNNSNHDDEERQERKNNNSSSSSKDKGKNNSQNEEKKAAQEGEKNNNNHNNEEAAEEVGNNSNHDDEERQERKNSSSSSKDEGKNNSQNEEKKAVQEREEKNNQGEEETAKEEGNSNNDKEEETAQREGGNNSNHDVVAKEGGNNNSHSDEKETQKIENNNHKDNDNNCNSSSPSSLLWLGYKKFVVDFCLYHKSDMVVYEAARSIIISYDIFLYKEEEELLLCCRFAIIILQMFVSSSTPVVRYAAARTLEEVSKKHPYSLTTCREEFNNLLQYLDKTLLEKLGYTDLVHSTKFVLQKEDNMLPIISVVTFNDFLRSLL